MVLFVVSVLEGGTLYKFIIVSKDNVHLSIFCYLFNLTYHCHPESSRGS